MEDIRTNVSKRLLYVIRLSFFKGAAVVLKDIKMIGYEAVKYNSNSSIEGYGLLTFTYISSVKIIGTGPEACTFYNLVGPVVVMQGSNMYITGIITFSNILAAKWATGSAIMLQVESKIYFVEPLHAAFSNNTAMSGGAIGCLEVMTKFCVLLYQPLQIVYEHNISDMDIRILFSSNAANLAGNSIYIDQLYTCSVFFSPNVRVSDVQLLYNSTFKFFSEIKNGLLEMSSTPHEVCLCTGELNVTSKDYMNCARDTFNVSRVYTFPGKTFSLCIVVVDEIQKPVYSSVYINPLPSYDDIHYEFDWKLGDEQDIATILGTACTCLNLTLYSSHVKESNGTLIVYPNGKQTSLVIPITMKECPLGFNLSDGVCKCDKLLSAGGFECSIDQKIIAKPESTVWVGESHEGRIAYSPHCPDRYCSHVMIVNALNFNSQCKYNRTGVLCGKCSGNLSTVFGHPSCQDCSNLWLLSIILYAFICLLLVIVLFALRLTIATGTINGVIFFANILNFNTFYFLEYDSTSWLRVFLSWLNLDIGFPICFFNGMTSLHSSYLGFFVPIYLWLIVLMLSYLSRHSQRISNLTSRSAVPVLATLIHLSFSRLLRLTLDGLIIVELEVSGRTGHAMVWYYDGNLKYFNTDRLGLFLLAILSLFIFVIPYTIFFTGIKFFLRFKVVNKFRPFVDAFCAPYKDKYRFWFGARLWVLIISFSLYGFIRNKPYLVMLLQTVMLVCFTIVQALVLPYKNTLLNMSELVFLIDAIVILTIGLYYRDNSVIETATNIVMIPAILLFFAIIAYHIYVHILREKLVRKKTPTNTSNEVEKEDEQTPLITDSNTTSYRRNFSSVVVNTLQEYMAENAYRPGILREPLIESASPHN